MPILRHAKVFLRVDCKQPHRRLVYRALGKLEMPFGGVGGKGDGR